MTMTVEERLEKMEYFMDVLKEKGIIAEMSIEELCSMSDGEIMDMLNKTTFPQPNKAECPDAYLTDILLKGKKDYFRGRLYKDLPDNYPFCPECGRPLTIIGMDVVCLRCRNEFKR